MMLRFIYLNEILVNEDGNTTPGDNDLSVEAGFRGSVFDDSRNGL